MTGVQSGRRRPGRTTVLLVALLLLAGLLAAVVLHDHLVTGGAGERAAPVPTPQITGGLRPRQLAGGCVRQPSACGFPDASNTGAPDTPLVAVPDQVRSGRGWHWDPRGWVEIDGAGAVFRGFQVRANVDVSADDVTVAGNLISSAGNSFGVSIRHARGSLIQGNTIRGPSTGADRLLVGVKTVFGDESDTRVIGNDISRVSTGIQLDAGLVSDNYVHDLGYAEGDHVNGITSNGGSAALTISHNTVLNSHDQTDAVSLFEDFGAQRNKRIVQNLLAGGGYVIYGGANAGGQPTRDIVISGNRISRLFFPDGGRFGPLAAFDAAGAGNAWTANVWDDTGLPVPG
jgi:hypothetical protein